MDGLALLIGLIALLIAFLSGRRLTNLEVRLSVLANELRTLRTEAAFARPAAPQPPQPEAAPPEAVVQAEPPAPPPRRSSFRPRQRCRRP